MKGRRHVVLPPPGQPGGIDDPLRVGLSGAGIRWYLRYLQQGLTPDAAKEAALKHKAISAGATNTPPVAIKRASSQISPPSAPNATKKAKTANSTASSAKVSYAEAVHSTRLAVIPKDYPKVSLSAEQASALEEAIVEEMVTSETEVELKFNGIHFKPGFILVDCANPQVAEWLKAAATKLGTWQGPELTTCAGGEIPQVHTIRVFLPKTPGWTADKLLGLLQKQNQKVNTNLWRVLKTKPEGTGQLLNISIDERSADVIRSAGHRLTFRYGQISVLGLKKPGQNPDGASNPPAQKPAEEENPSTSVGTNTTPRAIVSGEAPRERDEPLASDEESLLSVISRLEAEFSGSNDKPDDITIIGIDEGMLLEEQPQSSDVL